MGGKALSSIEEKTENLLINTIQDLGYELYDVQYVKEGKDYYLRIFIDRPEGISLEDCEKVSNSVDPILDKEDYIKEQYFLEVSSPGIERILKKDKHLQDNIGNLVEIRLFKQVEKQKKMQGILKEFDEQNITIESEGKNIQVERKNIAVIRTVYNW